MCVTRDVNSLVCGKVFWYGTPCAVLVAPYPVFVECVGVRVRVRFVAELHWPSRIGSRIGSR